MGGGQGEGGNTVGVTLHVVQAVSYSPRLAAFRDCVYRYKTNTSPVEGTVGTIQIQKRDRPSS